ncbi:nitrate- and nitrite sensing domain-containing protein [Streptomyces sp. NPDC058256]|uniref:sensor histidine kinase n=1 Tax=Streptomyces sp. NPDC058256 TaxID=3346408 RepID=UPI0036E7A51D
MRTRLIVVAAVAIAALLALVAASAVPSWRQQDNLRDDSLTGRLGGEASLPLFIAAQTERKLTAAYLADPSSKNRAALPKQWTATDQGIANFRHLSGTRLRNDERHRWDYIERIYTQLDQISAHRRTIDNRTATLDTAAGYYTRLITTMVQFYQALSAMDDPALVLETRPLVGLFWASEGLAQQDTLLAASRASGRMTPAHRAAFAEAYGTQQVMYTQWIAPYLPASEKRLYDQFTTSKDWKTVRRIEQGILNAPGGSSGASLGEVPDLEEWDATYGRVTQQLGQLNRARTQSLLAHGVDRANQIRTQVYILVGASLGMISGVAALILGLLRAVIRRSRQVRDRANMIAHAKLPQIILALQQGYPADTSMLPAPPTAVRDEFDHIDDAVSVIARQAARSAEVLSTERRGFETFTGATAARAAQIIHGPILRGFDALQRQFSENTPVRERLYVLDYEVARVRRLIENVMVLSGGELDHPHDEAVHIANVILNAKAESAGVNRVQADFGAGAWIQPHAASELTHLLAELIDNAAVYTPDVFEITVRSRMVGSGVVVEIEDCGHPLSPDSLARLNQRLDQAPPYSEIDGNALGLFVVGRLAQGLQVSVTLRQSAYGGVLAIVLIPWELHAQAPDQPPTDAAPPRSEPAPGPTHSAARPLPTPPGPGDTLPLLPRRPPAQARPADGVRTALARSGQPLPERHPGKHLAPQLRTGEGPLPPATASDRRSLEQIADDFSVLDDLAHPTNNGDNR